MPTAPAITSIDHRRTAAAPSARPAATPSLGELAGAAKADRNRAVDLYRVVAMAAVAVGHWIAMAISVNPDGSLNGGNASAKTHHSRGSVGSFR
ncbi:MAG: hypothetical protein R2710_14400 [Acidimicrobiales bacterium]